MCLNCVFADKHGRLRKCPKGKLLRNFEVTMHQSKIIENNLVT